MMIETEAVFFNGKERRTGARAMQRVGLARISAWYYPPAPAEEAASAEADQPEREGVERR